MKKNILFSQFIRNIIIYITYNFKIISKISQIMILNRMINQNNLNITLFKIITNLRYIKIMT